MKKFAVIFVVIFSSCGQAPKESQVPTFDSIVAEESTIDINMLDTSSIDSTSYKMASLLVNTENTHKALKEENKALKKELKKTKTELYEMKAVFADTIEGAD